MEYTWQILKCGACNNIHAMPLLSLHTIYSSSESTYTCPYCGTQQLIYSSKCDKMRATRGINNKSIDQEKDKWAYTE